MPTPPSAKRTPSSEAATLGEPSYSWRSGQERRLSLMRRYAPLEDRWVLDVGCGVGTYVRRFASLTPHAFGVDVSLTRLAQAGLPRLVAAEGERLPFRDESFDVLVFNEVIEHVRDDRQTLEDALRVLRPGGQVVIFAPNRLYPFETHGIYVGDRYRFGNFPMVNYLPDRLRDRLVPHARAYTQRDIRALVDGLPARVVVHSYVYPGFDNVAVRRPRLGGLLRQLLYRAEQTPARRLGLSHFVVLEKR
jgi:SAM-dependent methyltransferase